MQSDVEREDHEKNGRINTKKLFTVIRKQENKNKRTKTQNSWWFDMTISFD
jgi:hypothetical protein